MCLIFYADELGSGIPEYGRCYGSAGTLFLERIGKPDSLEHFPPTTDFRGSLDGHGGQVSGRVGRETSRKAVMDTMSTTGPWIRPQCENHQEHSNERRLSYPKVCVVRLNACRLAWRDAVSPPNGGLLRLGTEQMRLCLISVQ